MNAQQIKIIFRKGALRLQGSQRISPKTWVKSCQEIQDLKHRNLAVVWTLGLFTLTVVFTLFVIIAQGFHLWGFDLPPTLLHYLGLSTVGQTAALVGAVFKFLFHSHAQ